MIIRHVNYPEMRLRVLAYDKPKILCECIVPALDWELWNMPGKLYEWDTYLSVWIIVPKPHKSHLPDWL